VSGNGHSKIRVHSRNSRATSLFPELGLNPDIKPGYEGIRIKYRIKSDADEATLRKFIGMSPVCDTVCRPVPLSIEIEKV